MKKKLLIAASLLLITIPVLAVFNEKDLGQTLSVLRAELNREVEKMEARQENINKRNRSQHRQMVEIMKKCNELSLMLYSQNQDCTFDMTYALKEVTKQYDAFNSRKLPFDDIVSRLDLEIERYSRLIESLRRLPPRIRRIEDLPDSLAYRNDSLRLGFPRDLRHAVRDSLNARGNRSAFFLNEQGQADRDSCIRYATALLKMFSDSKDRIIKDNEHYEDANARLKESYDYAQARYKVLQRRMFTQSQSNYLRTISKFGSYTKRAVTDAKSKYGFGPGASLAEEKSEWQGTKVFGFVGMMFLALMVAFVLCTGLLAILKRKIPWLADKKRKEMLAPLALLASTAVFTIFISTINVAGGHNFFKLATALVLTLSWLVMAILLSILIRLEGRSLHAAMRLYLPMVILGVVVVTFRIVFIPNQMMNLLLPLFLALAFIWQLIACRRNKARAEFADRVMGDISLGVLFITAVMSWVGYVFLSIQIVIWWLFQLASIETVIAFADLLQKYFDKRLKARVVRYKSGITTTGPKAAKGEYITITWAYDFVKMVLIPVAAILSLPFSIRLALDVFDMTEICNTIFYTTFFDFKDANGNEMIRLSMYMIIVAACLFFLFRFLNYLIRSLFRYFKLNALRRSSGKSHIHTNEVNLTLANNVISILVWGIYIIITFTLIKIPTGALSIIAAGLATGVGLAMKDILNNFIYGIQLMSGRLRVGDWVECDGVRGKVMEINYQSTQIETIDGAVMSFLNTALFNKNFKNLTRNNAYEFVKIPVGVSYGVDVDKVRDALLEAMKTLQTKDKYDRDIVDGSRGISITFDEFGDSSVNLAVKQFVLVSEKVAYIARAKELIYNTLNENGFEIPFPQVDVHMKES